jgi:hypothetical protein
MKSKIKNNLCLVATFLIVCVFQIIEAADSLTTGTDAPVLSLAIRCTNAVVKAGDEIDIEFRITNRGTTDYKYADRTYDRSGRMDEYKLMAKNESGETIPDPRANDKENWFGGGLFQYAILKPGQSFTKTIPLNRWALVKEPGRYTVVATNFVDSHSTNVIAVISNPITVTVLPRTAQEIDDYIADLTNRLEAKLTGNLNPFANESRPPDSAMNELVMKLMFTCSPKIVPSLLKSMCDYGSGGGFWEVEAIKFYVPHTEDTKRAILATANTRGLGRNWSLLSLLRDCDFTKEELKPLIERSLSPDYEREWIAGAELAQKFPDDAFNSRLIAIANTPGKARTDAIIALVYNRTDEGIKALQALLNDPDPAIWAQFAVAILNAIQPSTHMANRPLQPGDFTAENLKPLIDHLLNSDEKNSDAIWGVSLIEQFAIDTYTPQLIAIANHPNKDGARYTAIYALAFNRTDEGVKALQQLLHRSDPTIRDVTEKAIRSAYTSRGNLPGRPLKPEDFDAKYRQPEPGKSNL